MTTDVTKIALGETINGRKVEACPSCGKPSFPLPDPFVAGAFVYVHRFKRKGDNLELVDRCDPGGTAHLFFEPQP